ncbi:hypothetical protein BN988_01599 [Oceanobacillus picturae]|uniref:Uncharacterized protein n=1 Tax=Oceanobacillus picturae TaxID=171693 RepID=W9ABK7_9BACI|nr:hypothetical protein [Oceanobacillus picturae]CDO03099.1 hypothetical protein BN988_01599 [Oceanobacillus picturae]
MSINKVVKGALSPLNVPINYITAGNEDPDYIIFNDYNPGPTLAADDEEKTSNYFIQLDIISSGNFIDLVNQAKQLMKQSGFSRSYEAPGEFDENLGRFRKTIRFIYPVEQFNEEEE